MLRPDTTALRVRTMPKCGHPTTHYSRYRNNQKSKPGQIAQCIPMQSKQTARYYVIKMNYIVHTRQQTLNLKQRAHAKLTTQRTSTRDRRRMPSDATLGLDTVQSSANLTTRNPGHGTNVQLFPTPRPSSAPSISTTVHHPPSSHNLKDSCEHLRAMVKWTVGRQQTFSAVPGFVYGSRCPHVCVYVWECVIQGSCDLLSPARSAPSSRSAHGQCGAYQRHRVQQTTASILGLGARA